MLDVETDYVSVRIEVNDKTVRNLARIRTGRVHKIDI